MLLKRKRFRLALLARVEVDVGNDELVAFRLVLCDDVSFWVDDHRARDERVQSVVVAAASGRDQESWAGIVNLENGPSFQRETGHSLAFV